MVVNLVGVVAAAIASFIIGAIWYGPLFGRKWMSLMGWGKMKKGDIDKMKKSAGKGYATGFIGFLVLSYVLAYFLDVTQTTTIAAGMQIAFLAWLGFVATVTAGSVIWEGKSKDLYFLNNAYQLVSMLVMSAILVYLM